MSVKNSISIKFKKSFIFLSLLFVGNIVYGQEECYKIFRAESITEFKKTNYQKAIDNLKVASSCEDKPKVNDIYDLIEKNQKCINYKTQADKLLAENNYEIALYFFKQLENLNPEDKYAQSKVLECEEKLKCFPSSRNLGNVAFRESKYEEALKHFTEAQKCEVKPIFNDIGLLTENIKQCIYFRQKGDSLLAIKDYKRAEENYFNVLMLNPYDNYCKEQIKKVPSEFEQFIEKPIKQGWFVTLNFSTRNVASFYNDKSFKIGDGFVGLSGGKMNNWGFYGSLTLGSTSLWGFSNYESSVYLNEVGDEVAFVLKENEHIPSVEDRIYLIENSALVHRYPEFTRHTNISFSLGGTKRIINKEKFKMHLTAGLGWANWGAEQKRYRNTNRILVEPNEPKLYFILNNGEFETTSLSEYWVDVEDGAYFYNFKSALAWEAGLMFNYNRFTLNMNTSFMFEGNDKANIDTYNQMISIGLGYSW